jgi:CotH kinase protein/Lamin Tail Domain/Chitobiase/beta-hexosaminidase C-terminal domain
MKTVYALGLRRRAATMLAFWAVGAMLLQTSRIEAAVQDLRISEFMASNKATLADTDGDFSDWIEIHNTGTTAVNMTGLYLTDTIDTPLWTFPASTLAADGYLIVFADDKAIDPAIELHANFKLSASGDYLGLLAKDGVTVISQYAPTFPPQTEDVSYGIDSNGDLRYFSNSTPGAPNGVGELPTAARAFASVDRGFYNATFKVQLNTTQPGATIRFTRNGSEPTASNGTVYSSPITINTTTVLRIATFADGFAVSPTNTYSYVFLGDVIVQPAIVKGFPNGVNQSTGRYFVPLDMEMDPNVVKNYSDEILSSMAAIPTMSLTAGLTDMFGHTGFYFNEIETKCSMEIIYGATPGTNEQIDVGVESHSWNRLKRSLRLNFRSEYGSKEWKTSILQNAPLNGDSATKKHRTLILRGGNNRGWARDWNPDATEYTIDQFYRDSQVVMSGFGSRGTFVHLYLNGVYWGVYNLVERPDDEFLAEYFGGSNEDWFYTKQGGSKSPDPSRWNYLIGPLSNKNMSNATNYAEMQEYLNVENFADYMLLAFYMGITDWPENNWYFGHRTNTSSLGPTPGNFFAWDGEWSFDRKKPGSGYNSGNGAYIQSEFIGGNSSGVPIVKIWRSLWRSPTFRALFAERVTLHTAPGGTLSPAAALARWDTLNNYTESAIVGESARWGDSLETLGGSIYSVTRTRDVDWYAEITKIRGILRNNRQTLINALENAGFYSPPPTPASPIAPPSPQALIATPVTAPIATPAAEPIAQPVAPPVVPSTTTSIGVVNLLLINSDTDQPIESLVNGTKLSLSALPTMNLNIKAVTLPNPTGSVRFAYDSKSNFRTENMAPYAMAGDDSNGNYSNWTPALGNHTVTATPYSSPDAGGQAGTSMTVKFTVVA